MGLQRIMARRRRLLADRQRLERRPTAATTMRSCGNCHVKFARPESLDAHAAVCSAVRRATKRRRDAGDDDEDDECTPRKRAYVFDDGGAKCAGLARPNGERDVHNVTAAADNRRCRCRFCLRPFRGQRNVIAHVQLRCEGASVKPHRCPACPKAFATRELAAVHFVRKHGVSRARQWRRRRDAETTGTTEETVACETCAKRFARPDSLRWHAKVCRAKWCR